MRYIQSLHYLFYLLIFCSSSMHAEISEELAKAIQAYLGQTYKTVAKIKDPVEAGLSGALGVMFLKLEENDRAIKVFDLSDKMAADEYIRELSRINRPEYKEVTQKMNAIIGSGIIVPKPAITIDNFILLHDEIQYAGIIMEMAKGDVFRNFHADKLIERGFSPQTAYELFKNIGIQYGHLDAVTIRDLKMLIIHPDNAGGAKNVFYDEPSGQVTWVDISDITYGKNIQATAELLFDRSGSPWEVCPNIVYPKIALDIAMQIPHLSIDHVTPYKHHFEIELSSCRGLVDGYIDGAISIKNQTKNDTENAAIGELIVIFKKSYNDLLNRTVISNASIMNAINNLMQAYKLQFVSPWWKL